VNAIFFFPFFFPLPSAFNTPPSGEEGGRSDRRSPPSFFLGRRIAKNVKKEIREGSLFSPFLYLPTPLEIEEKLALSSFFPLPTGNFPVI